MEYKHPDASKNSVESDCKISRGSSNPTTKLKCAMAAVLELATFVTADNTAAHRRDPVLASQTRCANARTQQGRPRHRGSISGQAAVDLDGQYVRYCQPGACTLGRAENLKARRTRLQEQKHNLLGP